MPVKKSLNVGDEFEEWGLSLKKKSLDPLTYVEDKGDHYLISVDLPLVDKKDVQLSLSEDALEISAQLRRACSFRGMGVSGSMSEFESFHKTISLPKAVDVDRSRAKFEKGKLEIEIQKRAGKKHLKIE